MKSEWIPNIFFQRIGFVVGFLFLTVGWIVMYPFSNATGTLLERIASQPAAWDWGHRFLFFGACFLPISTYLLLNKLRQHFIIVTIAFWLIFFGSVSLIGQYTIDLSVLAQVIQSNFPPDESIVFLVRQDPFLDFLFYSLDDFILLGEILIIVLLLQNKTLRLSGIVIFGGLLLVVFGNDFPTIRILGFLIVTVGYFIIPNQQNKKSP